MLRSRYLDGLGLKVLEVCWDCEADGWIYVIFCISF